ALPGDYEVPFEVVDLATAERVSGAAQYHLGALPSCVVRPNRELFVTDVSVVEDPIRTSFAGTPSDPRSGAWTFGRLLERAARSPEDASALAERLFATWRTDQSINGFTARARPAIDPFLFGPWARRQDGALDLAKAPLRLLGIVNRMDLRKRGRGLAGE